MYQLGSDDVRTHFDRENFAEYVSTVLGRENQPGNKKRIFEFFLDEFHPGYNNFLNECSRALLFFNGEKYLSFNCQNRNEWRIQWSVTCLHHNQMYLLETGWVVVSCTRLSWKSIHCWWHKFKHFSTLTFNFLPQVIKKYLIVLTSA